MARHPNPRLVKIHRNYTVEELALLLEVHKNTVRKWIEQGLPAIVDQRPFLILGQDLREFLQTRRRRYKRRCQPGEMYCVRCREPKIPYGHMVDYHPKTESVGNLTGICPDCESGLHQFIGSKRLKLINTLLDVSIPQAQKHISGRG